MSILRKEMQMTISKTKCKKPNCLRKQMQMTILQFQKQNAKNPTV